jgi:uncharacterized alpha-E superfamily protein
MPVTPEEIEAFRLRYKLEVVEKLAIKALLLLGAAPPRSLRQSQREIKDWLDLCSTSADQAYGRVFRDPAQMALYADEVKAIVEHMKQDLDKLVREVEEELKNLRGT